MKKTKLYYIFFLFQIVFFLIVPIILVWYQYGKTEVAWYKISITGIMLLLLIFVLFKKLFLEKKIKKTDQQLAQIEIDQLSVTEEIAILNIKKRYRYLALLQLIFSAFIPILILGLSLVTINVVETGAIKMFGVLRFCTISIGIGVACRIIEIFTLKCKNEVDNE